MKHLSIFHLYFFLAFVILVIVNSFFSIQSDGLRAFSKVIVFSIYLFFSLCGDRRFHKVRFFEFNKKNTLRKCTSRSQAALLKKPIFLLCLIVILWSMACNSYLRKVKSSELHEKTAVHERATFSQEALLNQLDMNAVRLQNDSSNYLLWFKSDDPFQFHPNSGLVAKNGELLLGGNNRRTAFEQENMILLESEWKDSSTFEKAILEEKEVLKSLDKERKINARVVGLGLVLILLAVLFYKRIELFFTARF